MSAVVSPIQRPTWLPTDRWPIGVETLIVDGHPVALTDVGEGPTLLLVHAGMWSFLWRDLIERLCHEFRVVTFGWRPAGFLFRSMLHVMGNPLMRELDVWTGWLPRATATRFGAGRHLNRLDRKAFRHGMDHRGRRSFHRFMRSAARHNFAAVETAVAHLRGRPALTIFGERNDPLRMQPRWRALIPGVEQAVVPKGYHFPMCDAPDLVAQLIIDWHRRH